MKKILLTKDMECLVDDEDYERLSSYRWHFNGHYAARMAPRKDGKQAVILMHRSLVPSGVGTQIDHVNGNKLDNRKQNLRSCSSSEKPIQSGAQREQLFRVQGCQFS